MATQAPPVKGATFYALFPVLDADGDPTASVGTFDSEISKDGAGFNDCTFEATEVGNGIYQIRLTGTEMNCDRVAYVAKVPARVKNTALVFYTAGQSFDTMDSNIDSILAKTRYTTTATSNTAIGTAVWANGTKTLTALPRAVTTATSNTAIGTAVWANGTKTLTALPRATTTATSNTAIGTAAWATTARTLTGKTGFTLTGTNNTSIGTAVWAAVTRTLTGKTGFTLTGTANTAIGAATWNALTSAHTTSGSFGVTVKNLLKWWTNKRVVTATSQIVYDDDSTTPLYTQVLSGDATTSTRNKAT